jgi:hypothetical protein
VDTCRGVRSCVAAVPSRHRDGVERRKRNEACHESTDVRLPGDRLINVPGADRKDAEQDIDAEPHQQKGNHTRVAKARGKRRRRHPTSRFAISPHPQRAAALECKGNGTLERFSSERNRQGIPAAQNL